MKNIDDIVDERTSYVDVSEEFRTERLNNRPKDEWPSRIDKAALDLLYGVAIGSGNRGDFGGTIGSDEFGRATGKHYARGVTHISTADSDLPQSISKYKREYGAEAFGELVYRLNELRYELEKNIQTESEIQNLNRAVEALTDKIATSSISEDTSRQSLQRPESVTDAIIQLFSDPSITEYANALTESMSEVSSSESFLERLDAPYMTTPLWEHQQDALQSWINNDCRGYVNMATATGKTVLGLASIALLYGKLHPRDHADLSLSQSGEFKASQKPRERAKVLVVAGRNLILNQWQSELDEHLNIPPERTETDSNTMEFTWGSVEFRTAQELLSFDVFEEYDLTILDEAHRYKSGSESGWRSVLEQLVAGSDAIIAMSGSIDTDWQGHSEVRRALDEYLTECMRFSVDAARDAGVIADFEWRIYYTHAKKSTSQNKLKKSTKPIKKAYDGENHKIVVDDAIDRTHFETLTDLRSFGQSKEGMAARDKSDKFDNLATNAFARRPKRWQLSPPRETIIELIHQHAPDQQCVVLVQSYEQAERIGADLIQEYGEDLVLIPKSSSEEQFETISSFANKSRGVIIGPNRVLGTGVDLPNAEVAINLGKGGLNSELIQQMGRVLRDPDGTKESVFYQLLTVPSEREALLPGEDGRRLLRRASEFRAVGARLRQLPGYEAADPDTKKTVSLLERRGADAVTRDNREIAEIVADDVAQDFLEQIRGEISVHEDNDETRRSSVLTDYRGAAIDRHARPEIEAVKKHVEDTTDTETANKPHNSPFLSQIMPTKNIELQVSPILKQLVEQDVELGAYETVDQLVDDAIGDHYISSDREETQSSSVVMPDEIDISLSPQLERIIEDRLDSETADSINEYVSNAIHKELELGTDPVSMDVAVPNSTYKIISNAANKNEFYPSPEDFVVEAIAKKYNSTVEDSRNNPGESMEDIESAEVSLDDKLEQYVIEMSDGIHIPRGDDIHQSQRKNMGAAVNYLIEEHDLMSQIDVPYHDTSVGRRWLIDTLPQSEDNNMMNDPFELSNGTCLQTSMGGSEKRSCLETLVGEVDLDVTFRGKWDE